MGSRRSVIALNLMMRRIAWSPTREMVRMI
jgi:hypothetical protein